MRRFFSASSGSQFRRNFVRVARANVLALVLPVAATPLLSRLFSPNDFAALAIFTSALSLAYAFCTWRFDWSLPNARTRAMAANLMALGAIVLGVVCFVTGILLLFAADALFSETLGRLGYLSYLFPLALVGGGAKQLLSGWFVREGDLTAVSRATISQSLYNTTLSILAGLAGLGGLGLIGSTVASTWAGIVMMMRLSAGQLHGALRRVTLFTLRVAVGRFGREATWSTLVAILNAVSLAAPVLLLAYYFPHKEVGWYALLYRLLAAPIGVLSSALGQSFWSTAADLARSRRVAELNVLYKKTTLRLCLAAIPLVLGCLAGPFLVGPILGEAEWGGAGTVLVAMTPLFVGSLIFAPTNHLVVFSRQSLQTLVDGIRLVLVVLSIVLGHAAGLSFTNVVALASFSSLLGYAAFFPLHLRIHAQHG